MDNSFLNKNYNIIIIFLFFIFTQFTSIQTFTYQNPSPNCSNKGYFVSNRCYCEPRAYGDSCQYYNDTCGVETLDPLRFENNYELIGLDIEQSELRFKIETPLYSNRQYTQVHFENSFNNRLCSYPSYENNQWIKNISSQCKEQYIVQTQWDDIKDECNWERKETDTQISFENQIVLKHFDQFNISNLVYQRVSTQKIPIQITLNKIVQAQQDVKVIGDLTQQVAITLFSFDNANKKGTIQFTSKTSVPYILNPNQSIINRENIKYELIESEFVSCDSNLCTQQFVYSFQIDPSFKLCELYEQNQIQYTVSCQPQYEEICLINPLQSNVTIVHEMILSGLCLESQIDIGLVATMKSFGDFYQTESNSFSLNVPIYLEVIIGNTRNVQIEGLSLVDLDIGKQDVGAIEGVRLYRDQSETEDGSKSQIQFYESSSNILRFSFILSEPEMTAFDSISTKILVQYTSFSRRQSIIVSKNNQKGSVSTRSSLYGLQIKSEQNEGQKNKFHIFYSCICFCLIALWI